MLRNCVLAYAFLGTAEAAEALPWWGVCSGVEPTATIDGCYHGNGTKMQNATAPAAQNATPPAAVNGSNSTAAPATAAPAQNATPPAAVNGSNITAAPATAAPEPKCPPNTYLMCTWPTCGVDSLGQVRQQNPLEPVNVCPEKPAAPENSTAPGATPANATENSTTPGATPAATTPAATEKPANATEKPAAATEKPTAATEKPTAATEKTTAANATDATTTAGPVVKSKTVTTKIDVSITIDLSKYSEEDKKATGNAIAYGIHHAACEGVKTMWTTQDEPGRFKCFLGESKTDGLSFEMAMTVDTALATGIACKNNDDCYGATLSNSTSRRLSATKLSNSGAFGVTVSAAALKKAEKDGKPDPLEAAKKELTSAKDNAFSSAEMTKALKVSFERPAFIKAVSGTHIEGLKKAAAEVVSHAAAPEVTVATEAPVAPIVVAASNSYTAGAASALMLLVGVFFF